MKDINWLSVNEASLLCHSMGLNRTSKTIRSWARNGHVKAQKKTTQNGDMWILDKSDLETKIKQELEFQQQYEQVPTGADTYEHVQTRSDRFEPKNEDDNSSVAIKELESKVRSLEIDKAVRDKHVEFLSTQVEEGRTQQLAQSRYIGHLETTVLGLGGTPEQSFLKAPIAEPDVPTPEMIVEDPHPDQRPLYSG